MPLPELATVSLRHGSAAGALHIRLERPDVMNAWDHQLGDDLLAAIEAAADPSVRAVTITGAGRAFSAGADLRAGFDLTPEGHPDLGAALRRYHRIILGIRDLEKPVVAAVNGPAVGIGCSLALACDLVLVAESAYFLLAFVNIGLTPDGGSSVFVPVRTGLARAAEMAMLGERVGADQALTWGLANRVIADDALMSEAEALADRLAAGPTRSYAATKAALNAAVYADLPARLEGEADLQGSLAASADFAEGVAAFTARRPPVFEGR